MFWWRKKKKVNNLLKFLDEADQRYMECYELKDVYPFYDYACNELCLRLRDQVKSGVSREFGLSKYRETTWCIVQDSDFIHAYKKEVKQKIVKMKRTLSFTLADDYNEVWTIQTLKSNKFIVVDIRTAGG